MRIVVCHNFYRSSRPSGENAAVLADVELLRRSGHEVVLAKKDSDAVLSGGVLDLARTSAAAVYSFASRAEFAGLLREFRPDAVHLHNLNPLWSPSVIDAARAAAVPVLQVLHNFRISCIAGSHVLDGSPCFRCSGKRVPLQGAVHSCYGGSRAGSMVMTVSHAVNAGRTEHLEHYLAVSSVVRRRAVEHGLDPSRVSVKPEYFDGPVIERPAGAGEALLSISRLDRNKGALLLIEAYRLYRAGGGTRPLHVAGDGPLRDEVEAAARTLPGVELLGRLQASEVAERVAGARAVVAPALWEEPFGLTVLEAWRQSRPVIVTDLGSPAEMVSPRTGWVVQPSPEDLARGLAEADDDTEAERRGAAGAAELEQRYTGASTLAAYERAWNALEVSAQAAGGRSPR